MKAYREFDIHTSKVVSKICLGLTPCHACGHQVAGQYKSCQQEENRPVSPSGCGSETGICPRTYVRYLMLKHDGDPAVLVVPGSAVPQGGALIEHGVAALAAHEPEVERLMVESDYMKVTAGELSSTIETLAGKPLEIGLTIRDTVARGMHGYAARDDCSGCYAATVKRLRREGVLIATRVVLSVPYESECELLGTAEMLTRLAFSEGSDVVSLSLDMRAANRQRKDAYRALRLPWLWSLMEIITRCRTFGPLSLDLHRYTGDFRVPAANCGACDDNIFEVMHNYNLSLNPEEISAGKACSCACRDVWLKCLHACASGKPKRVTG